MKNEVDLAKKYFGENKIPTRRELWAKIENLSLLKNQKVK